MRLGICNSHYIEEDKKNTPPSNAILRAKTTNGSLFCRVEEKSDKTIKTERKAIKDMCRSTPQAIKQTK